MSELSILFGGIFFLSLILYFFFPNLIKLWAILGLSSLGASLIGFWGYKDPYILSSFIFILLLSSLGALIRK